jgi:hypothetical protein
MSEARLTVEQWLALKRELAFREVIADRESPDQAHSRNVADGLKLLLEIYDRTP